MDGGIPDRLIVAGRPLRAVSPGFFRETALRRILDLAGYPLVTGLGRGVAVAVWGRKPWSRPGRALARLAGAPLVTVEDGPLRSVGMGRQAGPPLSLLIDETGVHYDPRQPSRMEELIQSGAGAEPRLIARARAGRQRLRALGLSKYNQIARGAQPLPAPGYLLVIDQVVGDAAITHGGTGPETFRVMLAEAQARAAGRPIFVKTHPASRAGASGYLTGLAPSPDLQVISDPVNPWDIVEGAAEVFTVSSQMGYEALLAEKPVHVFGQPFYAGWGLTEDYGAPLPRRRARISVDEIFACSHLLAPVYYDPWRDRLTDFEGACEILDFLAKRAEETRQVRLFAGFRPWKRQNCARYLGPGARPPCQIADPARALDQAAETGDALWAWASKAPPDYLERARARGVQAALVEDGFLRSVGLGAALVDAGSLVIDPEGVHYDPARPSRLEALIAEAAALPDDAPELARARALRSNICAHGLSKYNLTGQRTLKAPEGRLRLLVAGQVEDDASVRLGCGAIRSNLALLEAARAAHPEAWILYKPHPDVEAGLRPGRIGAAALSALADQVALETCPVAAIEAVDRVWTLTSLIGFEALMRETPVTCLGAPFYAGWELTEDRGPLPAHRRARPTLDALVWAALIAYPAYLDPVSGLRCPPEILVERLVVSTQRNLLR